MNTYFLSDETICAYLRDLILRLAALEQPPELICAVTGSGVELLVLLGATIGKMQKADAEQLRALNLSSLISASVGKSANGQIVLQGLDEASVKGKRCLLIDSAVHTGRLMNRCQRQLVALGASDVMSYALVLKRGSMHIPTFWGVMIDEVDRALFSLKQIPNNRLASSAEHGQQAVTLSLLDDEIVSMAPVVSGVPSMDRITWSDRLFDVKASPMETFTRTYVMNKASIAIGYLTVHMESGRRNLVIDEVALDTSWQGRKLGGVLMRFACTLARHHDCRKVRLYAIDSAVNFYEGFGFKRSPGRTPLQLDSETYHPMEKSILHEPLDGHDPEV